MKSSAHRPILSAVSVVFANSSAKDATLSPFRETRRKKENLRKNKVIIVVFQVKAVPLLRIIETLFPTYSTNEVFYLFLEKNSSIVDRCFLMDLYVRLLFRFRLKYKQFLFIYL